jgi:hypothetical protein
LLSFYNKIQKRGNYGIAKSACKWVMWLFL